MILRAIIQLFISTCVATLLAMGIGAGYLAATGKIDRGKLLRILAVVHNVDIADGKTDTTAPPPAQVSFEEIEKGRDLSSLNLEAKTIALSDGLQEVRLQRELLAEDTTRLKRLKTQFDDQLTELEAQAILDGFDKQRQIWTKIEATLVKDQIMDMVEADEIDDVVTILAEMPVKNQAEIISEFVRTDDKERVAVDEILRRIRKSLPKTALIDQTQEAEAAGQ
jgi:hypothetical protein